ncbi:ribosomal biogenesis protein LAS1L [Odontomachus brunneus]|uniref:ribosomal biogenesis protein LAS1L n=1 Tax=Odontomachus brunneus TaxID=486640 RepID=UPI0013F18945|nr:ribosomal biogenesis protein LAS1L [Odontomachus brunneus]
MALSGKRDDVKQVPWYSSAEWHDVYTKIYSNNTVEQTKAYKVLLAWKARIPKLPVGVDSTLSILQVCLRDREWSSKIDNGELPMCYENDLRLMYSTTIMRFLNHISNIGQTKQTSLFQIAQQLKIPEWIVHLRHNTAHGHELASLSLLRIAINILLEWLHEEYWAPEVLAMEQFYVKENNTVEEEEEPDNTQVLRDLIELWTSVGLYIHAGHQLVSELPDTELQITLQDLRIYALSQHDGSLDSEKNEDIQVSENFKNIKNERRYNLKAAQALLLLEISACLSKNLSVLEKNNTICKMLCENGIFLPNSDSMHIFLQKGKHKINSKKKFIPPDMLHFWKDIIILLQKKRLLKTLIFKLLNILDEEHEIKERKTFAVLWINTIIYSFIQLDIAHSICRTMEHDLNIMGKQLSTKDLSQHVKMCIHDKYPYLQNVLWIDISNITPCFLFDINFVRKLLLRSNEFFVDLMQSFLNIVTPKIDANTKRDLVNLFKIYTQKSNNIEDICEKIYTVDDLRANTMGNEAPVQVEECSEKKTCLLVDQVVRNLQWKSAPDTYQWVRDPTGLLPWQDSLESLQSIKPKLLKHSASVLESQTVAGILDSKNLRMESRINWDDVLWKRGKKRKHSEDVADVIMNRALEIVKKQK